MAKILYTAIAGRMLGRMAGSVFKGTKGGEVLQTTPRKRKTASARQLFVRDKVRVLSASWKYLSNDQRNLWNDVAAATPYVNGLGQVYYLSGFNLYLKRNLALASVGVAPIVAPNFSQPAELTSMSVQATAEPGLTHMYSSGTWIGYDDLDSLQVYAYTGQRAIGMNTSDESTPSNSISNVDGKAVVLGYTPILSGAPVELDAGPAYANRFGQGVPGSTLTAFCWAINKNSGITSVPQRLDVGVEHN